MITLLHTWGLGELYPNPPRLVVTVAKYLARNRDSMRYLTALQWVHIAEENIAYKWGFRQSKYKGMRVSEAKWLTNQNIIFHMEAQLQHSTRNIQLCCAHIHIHIYTYKEGEASEEIIKDVPYYLWLSAVQFGCSTQYTGVIKKYLYHETSTRKKDVQKIK